MKIFIVLLMLAFTQVSIADPDSVSFICTSNNDRSIHLVFPYNLESVDQITVLDYMKDYKSIPTVVIFEDDSVSLVSEDNIFELIIYFNQPIPSKPWFGNNAYKANLSYDDYENKEISCYQSAPLGRE